MNCPQKLNTHSRTPGKRRWVSPIRPLRLCAKSSLAKEPLNNMQLQFLITSEQRASGAMFMQDLKKDILAFIYPTDGTRTFHTFFCPPMRIVALSAEGQVVFDEVIAKWRWVKLPV